MGAQQRAEMETETAASFSLPEMSAASFSLPEMSAAELAPVEEILGYRFNNRSLASEALIHPSIYPRCISDECPTYDRLEFVGDAVLSLLVAREVYTVYPHLQAGPLTRLRAVNVDTERFARIAVNNGLHRYLRHKAPLLNDQEFIVETRTTYILVYVLSIIDVSVLSIHWETMLVM